MNYLIDDPQYIVYWIHHKCHTDVSKQGYVGITRNQKNRFNEHRRLGKKPPEQFTKPLYKALFKYGDDVVFSNICRCDYESALYIENRLRPSENIGWNIMVGGLPNPAYFNTLPHIREKISKSLTGQKRSPEVCRAASERQRGSKNHRFGKHHSQEHKDKLRSSLVGKKKNMSPAGSQAISDKQRGSLNSRFGTLPWHTPAQTDASLNTWANADFVYLAYIFLHGSGYIKKCLQDSEIKSKKALYVMSKRFKNGWIPHEDPTWVTFKESYKHGRSS